MPRTDTRRRPSALSLLPLVGVMLTAATTIAFASSAVASLAVSTAGRAFEGTLLESKEGRFSVRIPEGFSSPEESTMPLETAVGKLDMEVFTATQGESSVFMAAYIDYPESAFEAGIPAMLDGAREGALKNLHGKVLSQKSTSLLGHPGRSMKFVGKTGGMRVYGRVDYFIARPRLYQVLFLSSAKAMVEDPTVTAAFKTFTITQ